MVARGWGRENGKLLFNKFQFGEIDKFPEWMVKILNFILLYFTTIKTLKKTTLSFQVYSKMQIPRLWTQRESDPGLKLYTPENHCPFLSSLKSHFEP